MKKNSSYKVVDPLAIQQAQSIEDEEKMQEKHRKALKILKKRLLIILLMISIILLIIIFERVLAAPVFEIENDFIAILQEGFGINDRNQDNGFLYVIGVIGCYRFFLLIIVQIYLFIYFYIDSLIAIKIMIGHFFGLYIIYLLQMTYAVPRPFWDDQRIVAFYCDGSFVLPDDLTFSPVFMIFYGFHCYENRIHANVSFMRGASVTENPLDNREVKKLRIMKILLWLLFSFIIIIRYLIGLIYLDSIFMTFLYAIIFYIIFVFGESYFDSLIRRSVVENDSSKRLLFYWLVILILLQCLAVILYLSTDSHVDIEYIQNFV